MSGTSSPPENLNYSNSPSPAAARSQHATGDSPRPAPASKKRAASIDENGNPRIPKKRAAKACSNCRGRKVRCDVTLKYHSNGSGGHSCSNCNMDGIPCVLEESKRRKRTVTSATQPPAPSYNQSQNDATNFDLEHSHSPALISHKSWPNGNVNPLHIENRLSNSWSQGISPTNVPDDIVSSPHKAHAIYENQNARFQMHESEFARRGSYLPTSYPSQEDATNTLLSSVSMSGDRTRTRLESPISVPLPPAKHQLPNFLKPLPSRMTSVDIAYLFAKGALALPEADLQNALLRAYVEYVNPYMPLIEIHELLRILNDKNGRSGQISLLLYQAIMFAGTAFVDMDMLRNAGYSSRKGARKAFFQKARVLYDFDYELDRVSLVQSLLLMTYWYETPDDQKDTWHWMGVAISLAHTIGLHRNPDKSNMEPNRKKLWKRIWWSCFMRDRLVALGMRRPTRIKNEDYDVPMLTEDDFEIAVLSEDINIISRVCTLIRDVNAQRQLAQMCIAKAKLSLCISNVLSAQYSVLVKHQGMQGEEGSTRSSVMLFPKKLDQIGEVQDCDKELDQWSLDLPEACRYTSDLEDGNSGSPLFVQRCLLHMVYFTTLSALHRPQVLPSANTSQADQSKETQDQSRTKVSEASKQITRISQDLHTRGLEKYLPTTGVTVLLPAIIIHLLDIKSSCEEDANNAKEGFKQCMRVLHRLRDNYASADYATQFLQAAISKAGIKEILDDDEDLFQDHMQGVSSTRPAAHPNNFPPHIRQNGIPNKFNSSTARNRTPPAEHTTLPQPHNKHSNIPKFPFTSRDTAATTPPEDIPPYTANTSTSMSLDDFLVLVEGQSHPVNNNGAAAVDFNDWIDLSVGANGFEEGIHGESGGFLGDMDWADLATSFSRAGSPAFGFSG